MRPCLRCPPSICLLLLPFLPKPAARMAGRTGFLFSSFHLFYCSSVSRSYCFPEISRKEVVLAWSVYHPGSTYTQLKASLPRPNIYPSVSHKKLWAAKFMLFKNVGHRYLRLRNCETFDRVKASQKKHPLDPEKKHIFLTSKAKNRACIAYWKTYFLHASIFREQIPDFTRTSFLLELLAVATILSALNSKRSKTGLKSTKQNMIQIAKRFTIK